MSSECPKASHRRGAGSYRSCEPPLARCRARAREMATCGGLCKATAAGIPCPLPRSPPPFDSTRPGLLRGAVLSHSLGPRVVGVPGSSEKRRGAGRRGVCETVEGGWRGGGGLVAKEQGRTSSALRNPLLKHDWRRLPQAELLVASVARGRTIRDMVPLRCRGFGHTRTSAPPCAAFTLHSMCSLTAPFARGHAQRSHAGLPLKLRELSSQNSAGAILVKKSCFETGLSALSKQVSLLSSFFL